MDANVDESALWSALPAFAEDIECRMDLGMMESQLDWSSPAGAAARACSRMGAPELANHARSNKAAPSQKAAIREGMLANEGKALHSGRRRWAQALALCGAFSDERAGLEAAQTLGRWIALRHPDFNEPAAPRPLRREIDQSKRDCSLEAIGSYLSFCEAIGFAKPEEALQEQISAYWNPSRSQSDKPAMIEKARAIVEQASMARAAKPGIAAANRPRI